MRYRRAQGLPMNVIIIAALALLVLVILAVVFSGKIKQFMQGADDCISKKGECVPESEGCDGAVIPAQACEKGKICCVKSGG